MTHLAGKGFDYHYHGDPFGDAGIKSVYFTVYSRRTSEFTWSRLLQGSVCTLRRPTAATQPPTRL